jgi:hypothetical protein
LNYPDTLFFATFYLDDTKILRGRRVYDIITLVSEVSGLADIFFVSITFLIGIVYTPLLLESALHEHMGPCVAPKIKKSKIITGTTDKQGIRDILEEVSSKFCFKLSIWLVIVSKIVPASCRSTKTNHLF